MTARFLAFLLPLSVAACVAPGLGPAPAVPPIRTERVPAPPPSSVTLIWQPGHYDWTGVSYVWIEGVWVSREGHGSLWQDGVWHRAGAAWEWAPAHWL